MTSFKRTLCGAAGLGLLALAGCEEDPQYSYFAVNVTFNEQASDEILSRIATCGANVEGADTDFVSDLGCRPGSVRGRELGRFEWVTTETSGNVRFRVMMKDIAGVVLAEGSSPDVPITVGTTTQTSVVAAPTPAALMPRMP
jgi:hypothetical protein